VNQDKQFKIIIGAISTFLVIAAGVILYRLIHMVSEINDKHPDLGVAGWSVIIGWLAIGLILMEYTTRLCQRKKWSRTCHMEGTAVFGLYAFFSALIFLGVKHALAQ
jgi:hypothetical protein